MWPEGRPDCRLQVLRKRGRELEQKIKKKLRGDLVIRKIAQLCCDCRGGGGGGKVTKRKLARTLMARLIEH